MSLVLHTIVMLSIDLSLKASSAARVFACSIILHVRMNCWYDVTGYEMGQVTPASRRMRWRREVATNNDLSASHLLVTPALTHIIVLSKFIRHSERLFMWTACRVESACYRRVSGDHLTALTQRQLHRWLLWIELKTCASLIHCTHDCVWVWHQCFSIHVVL